MRDEIFGRLRDRWHELYDQYEIIKAALPPIVRYEWTNQRSYDLRPHDEKFNPPRKPLEKSTVPRPDWLFACEYGFDAQGSIQVERCPGASTETFYTYTPARIEITTYLEYKGRKLLNRIVWVLMQDALLRHYVSLSLDYRYGDEESRNPAPFQTERYRGAPTAAAAAAETWARLSAQPYAVVRGFQEYFYAGKQLTHIHTESLGAFNDPWIADDALNYDEQGELAGITRDISTGGVTQHQHIYRKRQPGETLDSLAESVKARLIDIIPQMIAAKHFTESLYGLNLRYHRAYRGRYFPPELLPAFERDRRRKLEQHPAGEAAPYIWWYLWKFDEQGNDLTVRLNITDPDALAACDALDTEVNMHLWSDFAEQVLYEICGELNKLDWSQFAPVTPDFIVYACDQTEHTDIEAMLFLSGATDSHLTDWYDRDIL